MKILFIGDIVGNPGRSAVKRTLSQINKSDFDFIIANCENLAHGRGITIDTLTEMTTAGIDFFTSGDHIFWNEEYGMNADHLPIIRPCNYPPIVYGKTHEIITSKSGKRLLVLNAMGRTFLNERLNDPFTTVETILNQNYGKYDYSLLDFHAEATSEKAAMGFYFDGKIDVVVGTHTHVPTCDQRVLPNGTLFISDVGMCGNLDSVLGVKKEIILDLYLTGLNQRFNWESAGKKAFRGVIINLEDKSIKRFDKEFEN